MILIAFLIFVLIAVIGAAIGMRFYVQPNEAIERVTGAAGPTEMEHAPTHPSLVFREVVKKLGELHH